MELSVLTPPLVEQALRAWRQAQDPPAELYTLHFLDDTSHNSPIERDIDLHQHVLELATGELQRYRKIEGLLTVDPASASRQELYTAIAEDFRHGNTELEAWSALCHRYLASVAISPDEWASAAHVVPRQFRRRVNTGIELLTDLLRQTEARAHQAQINHRLHMHLPLPDYAQLFGVEPLSAHLTALLTQENGPALISIEGIGGIGKTTLAQATAHHLIGQTELGGVAWISARHERLDERGALVTLDNPVRSLADIVARLARQLGQEHLAGLSTQEKLARLKPLLDHKPHLIVVDNLETLADSEQLLPALRPLAGTSRFLFTSRHTLQHFPYVHCLPVPELSFAHSQALIASELERRGNRSALADASMRQIYNAIGGLPLALKLVAAQMRCLPLAHILASLARPTDRHTEAVYTYIYWRTWQLLTDPARQLLLAMLPVSPDGEDTAWIYGNSHLPAPVFEQALSQLLDYSLLETAGDVQNPLYRLHRLTATFLQSEILNHWGNNADDRVHNGVDL
ncbi:MAG TPA: NB-ARC domain-containing protein [Anaerolineae bacterium]|nr:NB-ARC domain-containing protein [Anaerolineae bacterium]HQI86134.1 NB-ARC domain-containing protein [Anaerolineae bacterium]